MLLCALWLACSRPAEPSPPPDILLVVLDTVRADRLSAYGNPRPTSPQFDAVSAAGALYLDVTSSGSWTWPSHASLFTGRFPWEHGAHWPADPSAELQGFPRPDPSLPTLAERLSAAGYATHSLSANELLDPSLGMTRGFEDARTFPEPGGAEQAAVELLGSQRDRPLFLFINLMTAHSPFHLSPAAWSSPHAAELREETAREHLRPYLTPEGLGLDLFQRPEEGGLTGVQRFLRGELTLEEEDRSLLLDLYDGEIWTQDSQLNQLLQAWTTSRPQGVVAVTSDHGEHFGEQGQLGHRSSVYRPLTWVPLALYAPGVTQPGQRVDQALQLKDLHQGLLELAGLEEDSALLAALDGAAPERPVLASAWPDPHRARAVGGRWSATWRQYREGDWALVFSETGQRQLFQLREDPQMLSDRAETEPQRAADMLQRALPLFPESQAGTQQAPGEELTRSLRALGYLD